MRKIILAAFFIFQSLSILYGQGLEIYDKLENFSVIECESAQTISLSDYKSSKGLVLLFVSHNCPFFKVYETRILDLISTFKSKGIEFLFVNPNNPMNSEEDSSGAMAEWIKTKLFSFTTLLGHYPRPFIRSEGVAETKYKGAGAEKS